jgi:hypothetical protein
VQGLVPLSVNEGRYRKPFECLLLAQCLVLAGQLHASKRRQTVYQPALERESAAASFA